MDEQNAADVRRQRRRQYDRLSQWYDLLAHASEAPFTRQGLNALDVQPGERVLEIGFGTGYALQALCQHTQAVGADLSWGMCRRAKRRLEKCPEGRRAGLVCADALRLPLPAACVQAVLMSFTLELFNPQEVEAVLQEIHRVLTPGGRLAVVSLFAESPAGWMQRLYEGSRRRLPQWIDCRPIRASERCAQAGFTILLRQARRMWGLPVEILLVEKR